MHPILRIELGRLGSLDASCTYRAFHVRKVARDELALPGELFSIRGDVVFADMTESQRFAQAINVKRASAGLPPLRPSDVHAMGLIHEIFHAILSLYRKNTKSDAFAALYRELKESLGKSLDTTLLEFTTTFPPPSVYAGKETAQEFLNRNVDGTSALEWTLEEILLLWLSNENPAYAPIQHLVTDEDLKKKSAYATLITKTKQYFDAQPRFGPDDQSIVDMLLAPIKASPDSLMGQLEFMRGRWGLELEKLGLLSKLLLAGDFIREEDKWFERKAHRKGSEDPLTPVRFTGELYEHEPERFSADLDWMPKVVMMAKSTFVWLDQLSRDYGRPIKLLSDIPNEELSKLAARGMTALWLIGVWRRSAASARIKHRMGNHDAIASAYSLHDYEIAPELGGESAYNNLRDRAWRYGIRLASDMVPNHIGIDGRWVIEHPDWFIQTREPPFPGYTFNGEEVGGDGRVAVHLEDGYWIKTDAAVVFKRVDKHTGDVRYIYHGNDGTSMPWNDTAQLDYTKAEVREAVIQTILHVARMFPIIRFDAAMTLAKRHYQRLWFPQPGSGGDIPSRARFAMTKEQFDAAMPAEFWREVVDRIAHEVPDTLLLAEAFWLMEGYFVRTLGMHRVYNSAFMNMLKREENASYRTVLKNVLEYEPRILKRFVNFMNNPDEEPAVAQFGEGDKYFGTCVLLSTLPGLPMFGHGQIEGYHEKYGMEFARARSDERPKQWFVERHEREIFPLLKKRYLFAEADHFFLYDFFTNDGHVNEDVFAYSNRSGGERALVVYHNKYAETRGWIKSSVGFSDGKGAIIVRTLAEGLGLQSNPHAYVIFRDHTSGLEYLRKNREVFERGLYVELAAFKYHVFLDWREVTHTTREPYADLELELAGRGVPSIDEALVDLAFRPLHKSLQIAIGPAHLAYLLTGWDEGEVRESVEKAYLEKIGWMLDGLTFMRGVFDADEALLAESKKRLARVLQLVQEASSPAEGGVISTWRSTLREATEALDAAGSTAKATLLVWLHVDLMRQLAKQIDPDRRPGSVVTEWHLHRVIVRALTEAGANEEEATRRANLIKILAVHPENKDLRLAHQVRDWVKDHEVGSFLGVHVAQDVLWFNKERFEELMAAQLLVHVVCAMARGNELDGPEIGQLWEDTRTILAAAEREGYRLDPFLERVQGLVARKSTRAPAS
jgi:glycosidase